jgi:hypothetical protein
MASANEEADGGQNPVSWLLRRPLNSLMSLPVEYRWEFTRRHPYYQRFWRLARRSTEEPSSDPKERLAENCAVIILGVINVAANMLPPDPQFGPEALEVHDLSAVWAGGAVAPAMLRTLAQVLMLALEAPQRAELGRLLTESAEYASESFEMQGINLRLAKMPDPVWDKFPEVPFISINLQSSQRAISEAIGELVRKWKEERQIPERRRRDDKLEEYLQVWDLRDGWTEGRYESRAEQTFREIARKTSTPIGTVVDRYRTAFRYLSGHEYAPDLWIRLMGPLKLSQGVLAPDETGLTMRRPSVSPNLRPVTESVLLPGRTEFEGTPFLQGAGVTQSDVEVVDLSLDIQTLLVRGLNDGAIVGELELQTPRALELVAELRRRHENA